MPGLKVVALISGGKDSLFSILHCIENGHDVVALANLHPTPSQPPITGDGSRVDHEVEEIDSYMYQTVGHSIVPLYEEALALPLYRQEIKGEAVDAAKTYSSLLPSSDSKISDETESLVPLLLKVLKAHPDANAISSGAILSDYQRTRVETIAIRLGLKPLAYLWRYPYLPPQTRRSLLDDMASVGQDARIIKVASGGLSESHLWLNVADSSSINRLTHDMSRFGELENGSILGEGGEFETLAIDGPPPLWKKRIEIDPDDVTILRSSGGACSVLVKKARARVKELTADREVNLRRPFLLENAFQTVLARVIDQVPFEGRPPFQAQNFLTKASIPTPNEHVQLSMTSSETCNVITMSNVVAASNCERIAEEMEVIVSAIRSYLSAKVTPPSNILHTTILLRTVDDFAAVNAVYATLFDAPNPPSRVTIACGDLLPLNTNISVSIIANNASVFSEEALHVQSQSYWAPANIGPYSQAQTWEHHGHAGDKIVFFAGQIPLIPATMRLCSGGYVEQAILSLQHLWRVARAMNVNCFAVGLSYFVATEHEEAAKKAKLANLTWVHAHRAVIDANGHGEELDSDDDGFDIGDTALHRPWATSQHQPETLNTTIPPLPDRSRFDAGSEEIPPCFTFQVVELPRKASIEWTSIGLRTSRRIRLQWIIDPLPAFQVQMETSIQFTAIPIANMVDLKSTTIMENWGNCDVCEVYTSGPLPEPLVNDSKAKITPCRSIWMGEAKLYAVFMFLSLGEQGIEHSSESI